MAFDSLTFLVFFAIVWSADRALGARSGAAWRLRKLVLLAASWVFYAAWSPPFVLLLLASTLVDWVVGRAMARAAGVSARRLLLLASLTTNLGLLGYFKYGAFLTRSLADALCALGLLWEPAALDVALPVGISFYTFQSLSYTIDVYRKRLRPWPSLLDFSLYVSFFPQLVAGPIVRAGDFLPQCASERRATPSQIGWGGSLVVAGLFAKVVLADGVMAPVADVAYDDAARASGLTAWLGTLAFANQIYFDFWGYSTCAVGLATTLGFALPHNFRSPYAARGFSDFWRRWHVTLSSWLRDYLYVSLGGSRGGRARTARNLLVTMLLGGLWHGAAWKFVAWGGIHGLFLLAEHVLRERVPAGIRDRAGWAAAGVTFVLVCLAWVPFRAQTLGEAWLLLGSMLSPSGFGGVATAIGELRALWVGLVTAAVLAVHWRLRERTLEEVAAGVPWLLRAVVLAVLIVGICTAPGEERAFIYFQF